jgi:V/A-type H+-transporting ATPase subunit A
VSAIAAGPGAKRAILHALAGPVVRARSREPFRLREAVRVGPRALPGEVIRVAGDEIVAQVFEDTTGLRPGAELVGCGQALGIRVGPGLLGRIFDGLLRPLARSEAGEPRFTARVALGDRLEGGATFGQARVGEARAQACLVPPGVSGEVIEVAPDGAYAEEATVLRLRDDAGTLHDVAMSHFWPVRTPRPVAARLPIDQPLVTGQRVLDTFFPVGLGGKAAIPGGFGTGKTVLLEALAKGCDADVIVYLGCGERGNEMAGVLEEFPRLDDPRTGRPLMERTVVIANTSNMPVAAREASICTAATVAEYFRDQGLAVALMADSTSRWAEALREVSGRLGELPGEGAYPTYLASRIADFYERAARVRTLGGTVGSLTLLGSVSPPSGDFSEPVTSHTRRYVRSLWALDARRAHARFYPAIDPLQSYSEEAPALAAWWQRVYSALPAGGSRKASGANEWLELRGRILTLLDEEARLERMARIVGKDALPPRQRLALFCAGLANESLLRQSAFSAVDYRASPARQAAMTRLVVHFVDQAEGALARGVAPERIASMAVVRPIARLGEEVGEAELDRLAALESRMEAEFAALSPEPSDAP